jgi:wobble nucleotide-excising tRNase
LYFLHEVRGFDLDKGAQPDCVVVIDDPMSSMDSDSLFFISTNDRAMIREVKEGSGNIRQLMVLTHNVYFHKEVAHHLDGKPITLKKEDLAFHVIKKSRPGPNRIISSGKDSISSTYELLWADVRGAQTTGKSGVGLQNTMRRIIESFFNFTGNLKLHEVPDEVEGQERLIWRSLISWLHDGSHKSELFDEIHFSPDASDLNKHLKVFKQIFDQTGNAEHFSKMMRES